MTLITLSSFENTDAWRDSKPQTQIPGRICATCSLHPSNVVQSHSTRQMARVPPGLDKPFCAVAQEHIPGRIAANESTRSLQRNAQDVTQEGAGYSTMCDDRDLIPRVCAAQFFQASNGALRMFSCAFTAGHDIIRTSFVKT